MKTSIDHVRKQYNYVAFQFWATLDASCGIVYSLDGEFPTFEEYRAEIVIEPLGEGSWYYYYTNFD